MKKKSMLLACLLMVISMILFAFPFVSFSQNVQFDNAKKIELPDAEDVDETFEGAEAKLNGMFYAVSVNMKKKVIYVVNFKDSSIGKLFKDKDGNFVYIRIAGGLPGKDGKVTGSDDGDGNIARFNMPNDVCVDGNGNLWIADLGNNAVRKITCPVDKEPKAIAKDYQVETIKTIEGKKGDDTINPDQLKQVSTLDYNPKDDCVYVGGLNFSRIFKVSVNKNKFLGKTEDRIGSSDYILKDKDTKALKKDNPGPVAAKEPAFTNAYQICVNKDTGDVYFKSGWEHFIFKYDFNKKEVSLVAGNGSSSGWKDGKGFKAGFKDIGGLAYDPIGKGIFISAIEPRGPVVMYMELTEYNVYKINKPSSLDDVSMPYRAEVDWDGNLILPTKSAYNTIFVIKRK